MLLSCARNLQLSRIQHVHQRTHWRSQPLFSLQVPFSPEGECPNFTMYKNAASIRGKRVHKFHLLPLLGCKCSEGLRGTSMRIWVSFALLKALNSLLIVLSKYVKVNYCQHPTYIWKERFLRLYHIIFTYGSVSFVAEKSHTFPSLVNVGLLIYNFCRKSPRGD